MSRRAILCVRKTVVSISFLFAMYSAYSAHAQHSEPSAARSPVWNDNPLIEIQKKGGDRLSVRSARNLCRVQRIRMHGDSILICKRPGSTFTGPRVGDGLPTATSSLDSGFDVRGSFAVGRQAVCLRRADCYLRVSGGCAGIFAGQYVYHPTVPARETPIESLET
jgi:hypothetical protein